MNKIIIASTALALLIPTYSLAQESTSASVANLTPAEYVEMAASSDMFEIQSSQLALENAQEANIKEFAQHMVSDHSTTTEKLTAAAQAEGITVPTSMVSKHAQMLAKLEEADDAGFDAAYLEAQRMAHEEAVAVHSSFAENGDSQALKAVATEAVPIVTEHLAEVQKLAQ